MIPINLDPIYYQKGEGRHVFWHAIVNGLTIHPVIRNNFVGERKINENKIFKVLCSNEKYQKVTSLIPEHRKWLCNYPSITKYLLKIKYDYLYEANDQDGYSSAFNWLTKKGMNEHQIFNFDTEEAVNYWDSFTWFKKNKIETNTNVSGFGNSAYRKFNWANDFYYGAFEEVLRNVSIDVFKSQPLDLLELLIVRKPFQFTLLYLQYYFVKLFTLTSFTLVCLFVLYYSYVKVLLSRDDIYYASAIISFMFIFSLLPMIIAYPGTHAMFGQVILLHMIVVGVLTVFLKMIYSKILGNYVTK